MRTATSAGGMRFQHITGVILSEERVFFERMLFRISRGNCYVRFSDIRDALEVCAAACQAAVAVVVFACCWFCCCCCCL